MPDPKEPDPSKIICFLEDSRYGHQSIIAGVRNVLKQDFSFVTIRVESRLVLPTFLGIFFPFFSIKTKKQLESLTSVSAVISAGRRTIPASFFIKFRNKNAKLIHLTNPDFLSSKFDLVLDSTFSKTGKNVLSTILAPNKLTSELLHEEKNKWIKKFEGLKKPLTGVVIGGDTKEFKFTLDDAKKLADSIKDINKKIGGTFLIAPSRRTPKDFLELFQSYLKGIEMFINEDTKENPYLAILASASNIVVTGESLSMMSESVSLPKNVGVFIYSPIKCVSKYKNIQHHLCINNYAKMVENFKVNIERDSLNINEYVAKSIKNIVLES